MATPTALDKVLVRYQQRLIAATAKEHAAFAAMVAEVVGTGRSPTLKTYATWRRTAATVDRVRNQAAKAVQRSR